MLASGSRGYLVMNMILAALGQLALAAVTFYVLLWLLVVVGLVTLLRFVAKRIKRRLPQSPPPDPAACRVRPRKLQADDLAAGVDCGADRSDRRWLRDLRAGGADLVPAMLRSSNVGRVTAFTR
jgi:hypothetical protein